MKLVNKDITYVVGQEEWDEVLDNVYENERKYQGSKQHMRLRWFRRKKPGIEWWSELDHNRNELYSLIDGLIRKRVGRKFDDVYSEFLKDPRFKDSKMNWYQRPRDIFNGNFCYDKRFSRNRNTDKANWCSAWWDKYIVDSDGLIQLNPDRYVRKKNRNLIIRKPYEECEVSYEIRHDNVYRLRDALIQYWGQDKYMMLVSNKYLTQTQYRRLGDLIFDSKGHARDIIKIAEGIRGCNLNRYYFYNSDPNKVKELLFKERIVREEYVYGTKEYFIKRAELKKKAKAARKARKHPDRTEFDRTLWANSQPMLKAYWKNPGSYRARVRGKSFELTPLFDTEWD